LPRAATGWAPRIPLAETLSGLLDSFRRLAAERAALRSG